MLRWCFILQNKKVCLDGHHHRNVQGLGNNTFGDRSWTIWALRRSLFHCSIYNDSAIRHSGISYSSVVCKGSNDAASEMNYTKYGCNKSMNCVCRKHRACPVHRWKRELWRGHIVQERSPICRSTRNENKGGGSFTILRKPTAVLVMSFSGLGGTCHGATPCMQ